MWFAEIEDKVVNFVRYELATKRNAKYPKLNVTSASADDNPSTFPTLYIHELSPMETGQTLEGTDVNAIMSTFEIQVFTNTNEPDCKKIVSDAIGAMKQLRFSVTMFPNVLTKNNTQIAIARFRRVIGCNDVLY